MPAYVAPNTTELDEDHVRSALNFLIAIEPDPPSETREEYEAAIQPYRQDIAAAISTLRLFVTRTPPMTLEQMQRDYYGFTNDPRYLRSSQVSSIVRGALDEAWNGVGEWRR
jgi:hypothetical protein